MNISGCIFDLDSTLLDSMPLWTSIGSTYLLSRGIAPAPDLDERFSRMSLLQAVQHYKAQYELPDSEEALMAGVNQLLEGRYFHEVLPKPGAIRLLETLSQKRIPFCVATATDRYLVEAALSRNNMDHYFSFLITCNEVGAGKDRPDIYLAAAKRLGTPIGETPVFEDAVHAAATARAAGFPVVGVYDESAEQEQEALKRLSTVYCLDFMSAKELFA